MGNQEAMGQITSGVAWSGHLASVVLDRRDNSSRRGAGWRLRRLRFGSTRPIYSLGVIFKRPSGARSDSPLSRRWKRRAIVRRPAGAEISGTSFQSLVGNLVLTQTL